MKRLTVSALAALTAAASLAATASASPGPAQLQRQINALKNRVSELEGYVRFLQRCDSVIPVSQFGTSTEGYLYGTAESGFITTALDYDDTDTAPQYWVNVSDASCVQTSASRLGFAIRVARPVPHGWAKTH